jgi:carbonic anhydrase
MEGEREMQHFESTDPIQQVIAGVKKFQDSVYPEKESLFKALARKQDPKILFITCSDSRIDPSLITQTDPGSLFVLHNAGNIIPPHGTPYGGTGASIEYALTLLNVEHVILCGHSFCGAMTALLDDSKISTVPPIIKQWITYAETTRAIIDVEANHLSEEERLHLCVERNIQVQMRHLKTFPSVATKLALGKLTLHGWFYHIETGEIDVYDPDAEKFIPFSKAYAASLAALSNP